MQSIEQTATMVTEPLPVMKVAEIVQEAGDNLDSSKNRSVQSIQEKEAAGC